MMRRRPLPSALLFGALLGSAAILSPLTVDAQQPTSPSQAAVPKSAPKTAPAPASVSPSNPVGEEKGRAENKSKAAYQAFFDAKVAGLHAGLQLTPDQAPLWPPVEAAIRDLAKTHLMIHHAQTGGTEDSLNRLKGVSEGLIRSGQSMKALVEATEPMLLALTPDQKERLPILLQGIEPRHILVQAFNLDDPRGQEARKVGHDRDEEDGDRGDRHRGGYADRRDDDRMRRDDSDERPGLHRRHGGDQDHRWDHDDARAQDGHRERRDGDDNDRRAPRHQEDGISDDPAGERT